jgi:uncharacterized protein DUF4278
MTKMIYRGAEYDADQKKAEDRVFRRPELVYRGIEHNGVRTHDQNKQGAGLVELIYRGIRA